MEAGPINKFLFVASDFAHLIPVGRLLLLADLLLSVVHLVCLPADDGGLRRVWPRSRVKDLPGGPQGRRTYSHSHLCGHCDY